MKLIDADKLPEQVEVDAVPVEFIKKLAYDSIYKADRSDGSISAHYRELADHMDMVIQYWRLFGRRWVEEEYGNNGKLIKKADRC